MKKYPDPMTVGRYGRLQVLSKIDGKGRSMYLCLCDCGKEHVTKGIYLKRGTTKSCGCYQAEHRASGDNARTHGKRLSREYKIWADMKQRCHNPNNDKYQWYGARGIAMFEGWQNDFAAFFEHIGPRPSPKHEIDRIDNDKGYEPGNVRWTTHAVNVRNRRNTRRVHYKGEMILLEDYAKAEGISYQTAWARMKKHPHLIDGQAPKRRIGMDNNNAKLTDAQVIEIRASKEPTKTLRERYGVSRTLIQGIRRGQYRKHI